MGNKTVSSIANTPLSNYRWYQTTTFAKAKQKDTDLIWEPFPINVCVTIEKQYQAKGYFEQDNSFIFFTNRNNATNLLVNTSNVWEHKRIMRTDNIDTFKVYRKQRKQALIMEKTSIFNQFALALSQQMAYGYYAHIFKYSKHDLNDPFITQFVNHSTVLPGKFYVYLQLDYEQYLSATYGLNDVLFSFELIKFILRGDFSKVKELEQYVSIFIDNLTRENFHVTILTMFNEEGALYKNIIKLEASTVCEANNVYLMYYLCLLFSMSELNAKNQSKAKTVYFDTTLSTDSLQKQLELGFFNKDDIFFLPEMTIASKEKLSCKGVQIEIHTQNEANAYPFLQLHCFDVKEYSLYHEADVIIRPSSSIRCIGVKKDQALPTIQFELIEDVLCRQIAFLNQIEKKNFSIFDDISTISNDSSSTVAYAKVRQRKINYLKSRFSNCQALNFYDNEIGDEGIGIVANCFKQMKKLRWLNFTGNEIGESGLFEFSLHTKNLQYLSYLNFSFNSISDKGLTSIAFSDLKSLKYLILKENQITSSGAIFLSTQLIHFKELIELDLYNNRIEDKGLMALSHQFNLLKNLLRLDLYNIWCTDEGMLLFFKEWLQLESLSYLNLKQNSFGAKQEVTDWLLKTLGAKQSLTYLNISQNDIPSNVMREVIELLKQSQLRLKFIAETCEFMSMDDNQLASPIEGNNEIKPKAQISKASELSTKVNGKKAGSEKKKPKTKRARPIKQTSVEIHKEIFDAFIVNSNRYAALKTLSFEDCSISIEMAKLLPPLYRCLPSLITLNLSFCNLTHQSLSPLFTKINLLLNLRSLNLSSNYFGAKGMEEFSPYLKKLSRLETLDLSYNSINTKGLSCFSLHLSYLVNLRFLELYGNEINDEAMKEFCEPLIALNKLESLNLGKNQITSQSISVLCQCFSSLRSLTDLNLFDNFIGNNGIKVFFQYFNSIVQLKTFDLRSNCLSEKMKQYVVDQGIPRGFKLD